MPQCGCSVTPPIARMFASPGAAARAHCPSWVPADLVATLKNNRQAVEIVGTFASAVGNALTAAGGVGLVVTAVADAMLIIANDCDAGEVLKAKCRQAELMCSVTGIVCVVAGGLSSLGVITLASGVPEALVLVGAVAAAGVPVFHALGKGRAPRLSDLGAFIAAIALIGGVDTSSISAALAAIDNAIDEIAKDPRVRAKMPVAAGASPARPTSAQQSDAIVAGVVRGIREADRVAPDTARALAEAEAAAVEGRYGQPTGYTRLALAKVWARWKADGGKGSQGLSDAASAVLNANRWSKVASILGHDSALQGAKAKSRSKSAECRARGGHFDPLSPDGCSVPGSDAPGVAPKKSAAPLLIGGLIAVKVLGLF